MEISKCYPLPLKCNHFPRCRGFICRRVDAQQCVHAVILDNELQVMHGKDLYKLIDKNNSQYEHFYKLYDSEYLEKLRQEKYEKDKIKRVDFERQEEVRKANKSRLAKEIEEELFLKQASMTSEMKIRRN